MLKKFIKNLSYNPGTINQLKFYSNRLKQETKLRRLSIIFFVLAFLIQLFAFINPPQPTIAASPNDLVNGGFSSASQAAKFCQANINSYGTILANYSINCSEVQSAPTIILNSDSYNHQLFSMGRLPYDLKGETPVEIAGVTYYWRYLWAWDTDGSSNYQALKVTNENNQTYFMLYLCGNLVSIGLPQSPSLTITKTTNPGFPTQGSYVKDGQVLSYKILFSNNGGSASNVVVDDPLPKDTTYKWFGTGGANTYPTNTQATNAQWTYNTLPSGAHNYYVSLEVIVNQGVPNGTLICNTATIASQQTSPLKSNQVCMTVYNQTKPSVKTPPSTIQTIPSCQYNNAIPATSSECKPCQASLNSEDSLACVDIYKTAANISTGVANANGTTAQAGNDIVYTLYAKNTGKAIVHNYIFSDNLSNVLNYSNLINSYGGTLNKSTNILSWPAVNIQPNQTVFEKLEVQVMNPIPQTPTSISDPEYNNLEMINVYGNTVTIHLPASVIKTLETTSSTTKLVNTGPGDTIFIIALLLAIFGFFIARSRLLAKEANLLIQQQTK